MNSSRYIECIHASKNIDSSLFVRKILILKNMHRILLSSC
jgi:hypothetical protein